MAGYELSVSTQASRHASNSKQHNTPTHSITTPYAKTGVLATAPPATEACAQHADKTPTLKQTLVPAVLTVLAVLALLIILALCGCAAESPASSGTSSTNASASSATTDGVEGQDSGGFVAEASATVAIDIKE